MFHCLPLLHRMCREHYDLVVFSTLQAPHRLCVARMPPGRDVVFAQRMESTEELVRLGELVEAVHVSLQSHARGDVA